MSRTPEEMQELRRLIHALHEQCITSEESARLEEWICRDKEARRFYVRYMNLYAGLRWRNMQEPPSENTLPTDMPKSYRVPVLGLLGSAFQVGTHFLTRSFVLTLLLAIGLPSIVLLVLLIDLPRQPVPPAPVAAGPEHVAPAQPVVLVAKITQSSQTVWEKEDGDLTPGTNLAAGRVLQLREGLAELTFNDGAQVILRGPATFRIDDRGSGFLSAGSLAATVPPKASGFTIQTPLASVVDLGTEFGVSVGTDGTCETHVFMGQVELGTRPNKQEPTRIIEKLSAGQAVKLQSIDSGKTIEINRIDSMPEHFSRRVPPKTNEGLPEPRIIFAHHGDNDPMTEGWKLAWPGKTGNKRNISSVGPIDDNGTAAWLMDDRSKKQGIHYRIMKAKGLTPELMSEAQAKGWVLRARIKVSGPRPVRFGLGFCSYWENSRHWIMRPTIDKDGQQRLYLPGANSLGPKSIADIPNSLNRYIDYEMRYHPATDDADVFVDGQFVATVHGMVLSDENLIRFGTFKGRPAEMSCVLAEWGILDEP